MKHHFYSQDDKSERDTGPKVIYLCDGKACPEECKRNCFTQDPKDREPNRLTGCLDEPCRYTSNIAHAVNFHESVEGSNAYVEKEVKIPNENQLESTYPQ